MFKSRFVHKDLDLSQQQIRLLRISEGTSGSSEPIKCEIRHFDFKNCPRYSAVSYTWGGPHPTREILLSESKSGAGLPFGIRKSLWLFLDIARDKSLQHEELNVDHCEWFWIDAVCIHQANVGERNHQVQLMKTIYSSAKQVLSWLGPAADDSDRVMSSMRSWFFSDSYFPEQDDQKVRGNKNTRTSIIAYFDRPYWTRVWIVQEFGLAQKNLVMCGQFAIDGKHIHNFLWLCRSYAGSCYQSHTKYAWAVLRSPYQIHGNSLTEVLHRYRESQCSDVRDRVYGVLALVDGRSTIPVDYCKSAQELFFFTVGRAVGEPRGFSIYEHEGLDLRSDPSFANELFATLELNHDNQNPLFIGCFVNDAAEAWPQQLTLEDWIKSLQQSEIEASLRSQKVSWRTNLSYLESYKKSWKRTDKEEGDLFDYWQQIRGEVEHFIRQGETSRYQQSRSISRLNP